MLKAINLPISETTPAAQQFITRGGADALILWAPEWGKLEPAKGQVDESQWTPVDEAIAWAHGKLPTFLAVSSGFTSWLPSGWGPDVVQAWRGYIAGILKRHRNTIVIVQNEPDFAGIPAKVSAQLMRIAAEVAHEVGHPHIMGPAAATASYAVKVLGYLRGWRPPPGVQVGFAHHGYIDIDRGRTLATRAVLAAMKLTRWQGGQRVWITEAGYIFRTRCTDKAQGWNPDSWAYVNQAADEQSQLRNTLKYVSYARNSGKVEMVATYEYQTLKHYGWDSALVRYDGTARPLLDRWLAM